MGKANRQRRAAKAKRREKSRAQQRAAVNARPTYGGAQGRRDTAWGDRGWDGPGSGDDRRPLFTRDEIARNIITLAGMGRYEPIRSDDRTAVEALTSLPDRVVNRQVELWFLDQIQGIWDGGWQPAELRREAKRSTSSAAAARLVACAIAADHLGRPGASLDPRWRDQVESLDLPVLREPGGWFARWMTDEGLERTDALERMLDAVTCCSRLTILKALLPLPGIDGGPPRPVELAGAYESTSASDPVLERVRGLLAKAESTPFDAEAESFTAKAHELITRHAIDTAVLHAENDHDRPVLIRVPIDPPYVDGKTVLLQAVATATRCRVVLHARVELATIAGFPDDVRATELLFTSLLVQAQAALAESARRSAPGDRVRRQGYRSAFYLAYADRIGDRLAEINDHVVADADAAASETGGASALPILRAREARVDDLIEDQFDKLESLPVRGGRDTAGWGHGRVAADQAQLDFGDLEGGGATGHDPSAGKTAVTALPPQ